MTAPFLLADSRRDLAWPQVFRWLALVGVANGLASGVIGSVANPGVWTALEGTFGVSMITVMAAAAGWIVARQMPPRRLDRWDTYLLIVYVALLAIPSGTTSMAAVVMLACYAGLRDRRSAEAVAAASLFGCIGLVELLLGTGLRLFLPQLLALDATMAAALLRIVHTDATAIGNLVETQTGQPLIIAAECASASTILQSLLCWMAIVRLCHPSWQVRDLAALPLLVIAVLAVNLIRIAAMGISPASYHLVHGPVGAYATSMASVLIAVLASWWTLRMGPRPPAARNKPYLSRSHHDRTEGPVASVRGRADAGAGG